MERLTYVRLLTTARNVATALKKRGLKPGDRALLAFGPGLDFIRAFWGCVFAGLVPVPAPPIYPIRRERTLRRLQRIAEDCRPTLTLNSTIPAELEGEPDGWQPPPTQDIAFLQYTSGSTRQPSGVVITQENLGANLSMLRSFHGQHAPVVMVHWLPLYHDMGLVRGMLSPLELGADCYLMDPQEFVQSPVRWLEAISRFKATLTGAPNFGYELAARKVKPDRALDLSSLRIAFCSAEPIKHSTFTKFSEEFSPFGFSRDAFKPSYGLAEATVAVAGELDHYQTRELSISALRENRIEKPATERDSTQLVSCGVPLGELDVQIVREGVEQPTDTLGEIWLRGPNIAAGYWNSTPESDPFSSYLQSGEGPFLKTGDQGFRDSQGCLFVTGRLQDLLIIRGQNFHPHDIEATLEEELPNLRKGCTVAFQLEDWLGLTCECRSGSVEDLVAEMRRVVGEEFGLATGLIAVLPTGGSLKTSSGKPQRSRTRQELLKRTLQPLHLWHRPSLELPPEEM